MISDIVHAFGGTTNNRNNNNKRSSAFSFFIEGSEGSTKLTLEKPPFVGQ